MPAALGVSAPPGLVQLILWSRGSVLRRPSLGRRGQHPAPAEWFSSRRRPAGRVEERLHLPTGSGSAVFGLFDTENSAKKAQNGLINAGYSAFLTP